MQHGRGGGCDARQRQDAAEAEPSEDRQLQPADRLGDMRERVRALVAVLRRVGQRPHATGVGDDDERPPAHAFGFADLPGSPSFSDRATGPKVCSSTRAKSAGGANASTTTSALPP